MIDRYLQRMDYVSCIPTTCIIIIAYLSYNIIVIISIFLKIDIIWKEYHAQYQVIVPVFMT